MVFQKKNSNDWNFKSQKKSLQVQIPVNVRYYKKFDNAIQKVQRRYK